jgi:hypothetical protein
VFPATSLFQLQGADWTRDKVLKEGLDFVAKDLPQLIDITRVLIDRMNSSNREMRQPG